MHRSLVSRTALHGDKIGTHKLGDVPRPRQLRDIVFSEKAALTLWVTHHGLVSRLGTPGTIIGTHKLGDVPWPRQSRTTARSKEWYSLPG
jgi:hypothetical protein